jgi:NAD-dependent deacetylase
VWDWYAWRRGLVIEAVPNPGHTALVALEAWAAQRGTRWTLITQNVDGLHQRAGSRAVVELHGNLLRAKCFDCAAPAERWEATGAPPCCERCGGPLRPDVVWFGEALPGPALAAAMAATRCEVFLSVGTSGLVEPAASLPWDALRLGAAVVEVNPQATPLSARATYVLQGPSGALLPELARLVMG